MMCVYVCVCVCLTVVYEHVHSRRVCVCVNDTKRVLLCGSPAGGFHFRVGEHCARSRVSFSLCRRALDAMPEIARRFVKMISAQCQLSRMFTPADLAASESG